MNLTVVDDTNYTCTGIEMCFFSDQDDLRQVCVEVWRSYWSGSRFSASVKVIDGLGTCYDHGL